MSEIIHITSISQIHELLGTEKPKHPLVSLLPIDARMINYDYGDAAYVFDFYQVSLKSGVSGNVTYGRNSYDFEEGSMVFAKPGQVMTFKDARDGPGTSGWTLLFHPDLIRKSNLAQHIEDYTFFSYEVNEALHLSEGERQSLTVLAKKIETEYNQAIDRHTQKLIVANIELLLDYCTRYYDRQFHMRTNLNQDIITRFEKILRDYFDSDKTATLGLPSVRYCGQCLNISPSYLSDLLKKETGRNAQQTIQDLLIERAKNRLLGSKDQVSQIAYELGFEYPQHFSKMFKTHTGMSPVEYRKLH